MMHLLLLALGTCMLWAVDPSMDAGESTSAHDIKDIVMTWDLMPSSIGDQSIVMRLLHGEVGIQLGKTVHTALISANTFPNWCDLATATAFAEALEVYTTRRDLTDARVDLGRVLGYQMTYEPARQADEYHMPEPAAFRFETRTTDFLVSQRQTFTVPRDHIDSVVLVLRHAPALAGRLQAARTRIMGNPRFRQ